METNMVGRWVRTVTGVEGRVVSVVGGCVEVESTESVHVGGGWTTQRMTSNWLTVGQVEVVQR